MKLSNKVKPGQEAVIGSTIHPEGRYIFEFDEGLELIVSDKGMGNAYTYKLPFKNLGAADVNSDQSAEGEKFVMWLNVIYHGDTINKTNFEDFSKIMILSGAVSPDDDVDLTSQQFVDMLKLKLTNNVRVGLKIAHKDELVTSTKNDDGTYSELPEDERYTVKRAYCKSVFPVTGTTGSANSAVATNKIDMDY